jgi:prevent-host-death family protein
VEEITIAEAKTNFSKLVRRAEAGEESIVRRGRGPVARIVPLEKSQGVHGFGSLKGKVRIRRGFAEPVADFAEFE